MATLDGDKTCPKCGYLLEPFDTDCPKCRHLAEERMDSMPASEDTTIKPVAEIDVAPEEESVDAEETKVPVRVTGAGFFNALIDFALAAIFLNILLDPHFLGMHLRVPLANALWFEIGSIPTISIMAMLVFLPEPSGQKSWPGLLTCAVYGILAVVLALLGKWGPLLSYSTALLKRLTSTFLPWQSEQVAADKAGRALLATIIVLLPIIGIVFLVGHLWLPHIPEDVLKHRNDFPADMRTHRYDAELQQYDNISTTLSLVAGMLYYFVIAFSDMVEHAWLQFTVGNEPSVEKRRFFRRIRR